MTTSKLSNFTDLWWPTTATGRLHYLLDTSAPGYFEFACGVTTKEVYPRDSAAARTAERCKKCLRTWKHTEGAPQ